jgi:hypothetical protein
MRSLHLGHKIYVHPVDGYWMVEIDDIARDDAPPFLMLASALDWATSTIEVMVQETK